VAGKPDLAKDRTIGTGNGMLSVGDLIKLSHNKALLDEQSELPQYFKVVDFAGQEDYLTTHHLFLSAKAFCLLVVDIERYTPERFRPDVQVWLETLESRLGGSTEVLVSELI